MPETITIGNDTFTTIYPHLLRRLTPEEDAALEDSIAQDGIRYPIIVDEYNNVIDGGHRLRKAAKLGLTTMPHVVHAGLDNEAQERLAVQLNAARRHLSPEEQQQHRQQRVKRVAKARKKGKSTRAIAEAEGISQTQVREDLRQISTEQGCSVETPAGKVKGRDGKERKAKTKEAPPPEANGAAPDAPPFTPTDQVGIPLSGHMAEVFTTVARANDLVVALRKVQKSVAVLTERPGGEVYAGLCQCSGKTAEVMQHYSMHVRAAIADLQASTPYCSVCPWCHEIHPGEVAKNCSCCEGRGWVAKATWQRCPQALREAVLLHAAGAQS